CKWGYKLIGRDKTAMSAVVEKIVGNKEYTLKPSKTSAKGTFISLHLEVLVFSHEERTFIYEELRASKGFLHIL
ncbi:MAG: DUF493 domain-containing protein, partial [Campylobacterales bacterium]